MLGIHNGVRRLRKHWAMFGAALSILSGTHAQGGTLSNDPRWTRPIAPFHILGNIYYVGTQGLAAYLIVSPQGDVLLDGTLEQNAPLIERNIARLGFSIHDVRVLINSHAHFDHAGGLARLKQDSGARLWASAGDRWALEHGEHRGDTDFASGHFPPVAVDEVVRDGQAIHLGPIAITALLTPGHTPGCTTWLLPARYHGRLLHVVFPCSLTVAGNLLFGNRAYPGIVADYRASFAKLKAVQADVVLTAHPEIADVLQGEARAKAGDTNAFINRSKLSRIVIAAQRDFDQQLAEQAANAKHG